MHTHLAQLVHIPAEAVEMEGMLVVPANARGIVLFAHGSGSSRHSPRNNYVASVLHDHRIATLLLDLLSVAEDLNYQTRFDIPLLTRRLLVATQWVQAHPATHTLLTGFFGASTGAAAALQAAAKLGTAVGAVVSRGGRPDLAGKRELESVKAPTLLMVGAKDLEVIELNREAYDHLRCNKKMNIIPGASHLFEEAGTLNAVAQMAAQWFDLHLNS
jgi:putative phosphoribosyl transferase